jgi:hypothetical protein
MITGISCILLLIKSWTYACIFPPMKHVLFYIYNPGEILDPVRGSAQDNFLGVRSRSVGRMWKGGSDSRLDMIDIIFMLYLLKCRN